MATANVAVCCRDRVEDLLAVQGALVAVEPRVAGPLLEPGHVREVEDLSLVYL